MDTKIRNAVELTLLPRVGIRIRNRIRESLPDMDRLFDREERCFRSLGLPPETIAAIRSRAFRETAEEIVDWAKRESCRILVRDDPAYPALLHEIADPPLVLYALGQTDILEDPCIAIVGSRRPTVYGLHIAGGIAEDLGSRGIRIVSGLARGVDASAHRGCLEGGGRTIAVLGCGVDIAYPPEHRRLMDRIRKAGLILSEFPPGTGPAPHHFPVRNRIISGLSLGTVVVEAGEKSGSLITARLALEQNRDIFAVPGNLTSPASYGPNVLIQQGAKLVLCWRDIVDELPTDIRESTVSREAGASDGTDADDPVSDSEKKLLLLLKLDEALHFDKLYHCGGMDFSDLSEKLLDLELKGRIRRLPGNMYIRTARFREKE